MKAAESDAELAARFASEAIPLCDALARRARRLTRRRQWLRIALSHLDHCRKEIGDAEQRSA